MCSKGRSRVICKCHQKCNEKKSWRSCEVIWRAEEAGEIMKRLRDGVKPAAKRKLTSKSNELSEQEFLVNKSLTLVTLELLLHAARSALGRV